MLDVSEFLRKKVPNESRNKKRQINTQEQITNKVVKKSIGTVCISEMKDFCVFCLESTPTIYFSSNVSANKVYIPGGANQVTTAGLSVRNTHTKINLQANHKGYDTFETTVGKLLARRIQICFDIFCKIYF